MVELSMQKCGACTKNTPTLDMDVIQKNLKLVSGWALVGSSKRIEKLFEFKNFVRALEFFNGVAMIARQEDHHPDDMRIMMAKNVKISITTFAAGGLTRNDFILAAKIDGLYKDFYT